MRSVKCGLWRVECEVWSVESEESSEKCEAWSVKCGVWSVEWEVRSVKCGVWSWSAKSAVWSVKCGVRRVQCEVWSVECEECSVKCEVWSVKCEVELQMWHVQQDISFAECTHERAWPAHGACKFYRWERSSIYIFKATSAPPRAGTTGKYIYCYICLINPPAPKVLGRDLPDGTRKRLQVYLGGGIFRSKPPVFDRSSRAPSKNTVKNSTEDTCSWTRPSKIGKRKVKKTRVFELFDFNFLVCNIFFCSSAGGLARMRIFEFLDRFRTDFRRFVIAETLVFTVFFCFLHAWRLASTLPKTS